MQCFKKEIEKAKHFYFKTWRGSEKPCPAFGGEVVKVTRAGWNHLLFSPKRHSFEMLKRLSLLPSAKVILENERSFVEYRKDGEVGFWSFEKTVSGSNVKVVVRSVGHQEKHFFSVFEMRKRKKPLSRLG